MRIYIVVDFSVLQFEPDSLTLSSPEGLPRVYRRRLGAGRRKLSRYIYEGIEVQARAETRHDRSHKHDAGAREDHNPDRGLYAAQNCSRILNSSTEQLYDLSDAIGVTAINSNSYITSLWE